MGHLFGLTLHTYAVCVNIQTHAYMCKYIYIHLYAYVHTHMYVHIYIYNQVYVFFERVAVKVQYPKVARQVNVSHMSVFTLHTYTACVDILFVLTYIYTHTYIYMCMYICIYIYTYIHIYIYLFWRAHGCQGPVSESRAAGAPYYTRILYV